MIVSPPFSPYENMLTSSKLKLAVLISAFGMSGNFAVAQLGVSPSMNSSFLTELRARDPKRAEEGRDVLGDARQHLNAGHELSRPELFSNTIAQAQRLEADITGFPGQYQLGRTWLSPFYHGVQAPENTVTNPSGLTYGIAFEQTFEYNSRVNNTKGGVIFSPTLLVDGSYQIAPNQRFTFSGGVGLNWISGNDRIEGEYFTDDFGLSVLPGTSLAYDVTLGPVSITAYDRVSVRPYLGFLQNDLGIAATWQMTEQWSGTLNYTFSKTYDVDGNFGGIYPRGVNSDLHTVSALLTFQSTGSWSAGLEGSMNWYRPEEGIGFAPLLDTQADPGEALSLGAFVVWNVNKDTRVRFAAGYQHQTFDGPRTNFFVFGPFGLNQAVSPDLDAPYYSISFSQRLSDRVSHELAVGYESNLDSVTNNSNSHFLNYSLTGETWKDGRVTASAYYESSGESKQQLAVDTTSCGLDLHLAQRITPKLTASVGYSFVHTSSETDAIIFFPATEITQNQHIAGVSLNYALTAKTQVQLAWQAFRSEVKDFGSNVDHHRASLGIRVQF
jgi:hypothetical protein